MNKREFKSEVKKIKKILSSPKNQRIVKQHLEFWDKTLNNLSDCICRGLGFDNNIETEKYHPILVVNKYYLRVK
jgi:hypothetical protein